MKEKLYKEPEQKETIATHETPISLQKYGMLVCGFCGHLCSEFDAECGKCRQVLTFKYTWERTKEGGRGEVWGVH